MLYGDLLKVEVIGEVFDLMFCNPRRERRRWTKITFGSFHFRGCLLSTSNWHYVVFEMIFSRKCAAATANFRANRQTIRLRAKREQEAQLLLFYSFCFGAGGVFKQPRGLKLAPSPLISLHSLCDFVIHGSLSYYTLSTQRAVCCFARFNEREGVLNAHHVNISKRFFPRRSLFWYKNSLLAAAVALQSRMLDVYICATGNLTSSQRIFIRALTSICDFLSLSCVQD